MKRYRLAAGLLLTAALLFVIATLYGGKTAYCFPVSVQPADEGSLCRFELAHAPVQVDVESGSVLLSYQISAAPLGLYVITAEVTSPTAWQAQVSSSKEDDYNAEVVVSELNPAAREIRRICMAGADGQLRWQLRLLPEEYPAAFRILEMSCTPIQEHEAYTVVQSRDATVQAVFYSHAIQACPGSLDALQRWVDALSECRTLFHALMGGTEPDHGVTVYLFTEQFNYYALAGSPVYVNEAFAAEFLSELTLAADVTQTNAFWITLHEMSHVFDGIQSDTLSGVWNFDKEILADVKAAAVLAAYWNQHGLALSPSDICDMFLTSYGIDRGVYSADGAAYALVQALQELEHHGWDLLQRVFTALLNADQEYDTAELQFRLFWNELNRQYGDSFESLLSPEAWQAIRSHFNYRDQ